MKRCDNGHANRDSAVWCTVCRKRLPTTAPVKSASASASPHPTGGGATTTTKSKRPARTYNWRWVRKLNVARLVWPAAVEGEILFAPMHPDHKSSPRIWAWEALKICFLVYAVLDLSHGASAIAAGIFEIIIVLVVLAVLVRISPLGLLFGLTRTGVGLTAKLIGAFLPRISSGPPDYPVHKYEVQFTESSGTVVKRQAIIAGHLKYVTPAVTDKVKLRGRYRGGVLFVTGGFDHTKHAAIVIAGMWMRRALSLISIILVAEILVTLAGPQEGLLLTLGILIACWFVLPRFE